MEIETRIAGIPCTINVTHFSQVRGSFSYNAPSDLDYYGYEEIEFDICDRNGRPAPWLERKATDEDLKRIEREIMEYME